MKSTDNANHNSNQSRQPLSRPSSFRILVWLVVAVMVVLTSTATAAWAETSVPPEQVGGTVPPGHSTCKGALVARPDIAGTTTSSSITLQPLQNDMMVPDDKGPKHDDSDDSDDISDTSAMTLTAVTSPTHGTVAWTQFEVTATVTYTPDGEFTGSEVFSYTVNDECGRTAEGRVVVVVFRDDMPNLPAIVTKPVGPGKEAHQELNLSTRAAITIPAEIFDETGEGSDDHFFVVTDLGKPDNAQGNSPGPGKRFADVAFGIVEYRQGQPVEGPVYQVPLILEIAFDLAEGEMPTLFYWHEEASEWRSDGIQRLSYDPETGIGTFAIHHLTDFAIFADSVNQQFLYLPNLTTGGIAGN